MIGVLRATALLLAAVPPPATARTPPPQLAEAARLSLSGEKARALELLESLPQDAGDPDEILMWRAELNLDLLRIDRAAALYRERLAREPADRKATAMLAEALMLGGHVRAAGEVYRRYLASAGGDRDVERAFRRLEAKRRAIRKVARRHRMLGWAIAGSVGCSLLLYGAALAAIGRSSG